MKLSQSFTMLVLTIFLITTATFVLSDTNVLTSTDGGQAFVISTTIVPTDSGSTDSSVSTGSTESKPEVKSPVSISGSGDNQTSASLTPEIYSFHIDSDIRYRYSRTHVTSRVVNRDPIKSQEVTFRVVLPETAFISKFIMEIDGKAYEAYVKEKEEAKKVYNQAQSQGQSAGLVELNTRNANVFDVNVNIKAQAKVNFNLTYEELLSRRLGRYEQSISISPDQITNVKDFQIVVNIEESQNITLLKVPNLRNDFEAQEDSEGNNKDAIIERPTGNKAQIKWRPTEKDQNQLAKQGLTGKFIINYDIKRELDAGEILVMNGYFVHFFAPENLPALRKHVVFVLDTSGSMWGRKMTQLKEAMTKILADLNTEDYFNILTFSSDVTLWSPEDKSPLSANSNWAPPPFHGEPIPTVLTADPRKRQPYPATSENIEKAQKFIQSLVASGGTNIQDSIVQALNLTAAIKLARDGEATNVTVTAVQESSTTTTSTQAPVTIATGENSTSSTPAPATTNGTENQTPHIILPPNVESLIIFLTDGEPTVGVTDLTLIQTAIQAANKNISVPLFSLAFGEGADFPFVRKLSLQNNGFARKIYEAADAAIQLKDFYNGITSPLLANITFNYTSPEYSIQNLTLTKFSTVFRGTEIAVAGIIVPKNQTTTEQVEDVTTLQPIGSSELLEEVQVEGNQVAPTEKRYFDVDIAGFGRNGHVHFNNPEIFSSPIPWGIPVIKPFPPRPTPVPTQEDLFLERLWAYLTVQQLIEKDFAKPSQENEIPDENQPTTVATTATPLPSSTVVSTITIGNKTIKISTVVPAETPKQKALRLALKYGFVTSLTSLVVVKPNSSDVTDAVAASASPDVADSLAAPQSFNHFQAKPVHKVKFSAGGGGFTSNRIAALPIAFPAHTSHHQHGVGISSFQSFRPAYAQGNPGFAAFAPYPAVATSTPGLHFSTTVHHEIQEEEEDIQPGSYTTIASPTTTGTILSQPTGPSTSGVSITDQEIVSTTTSPTQSVSVHPQPTVVANTTADQSNTSATPSTVPVVPEETSSTQSPTPALNVVTSTSDPEVSPTIPSVSLTLDDLTWFKDSILVKINGSEIAHRIALNATTEDTTEGSECHDSQSGHIGYCTHLKDCLIPAIVDEYELYIKSYFCSIESRKSDVSYAGTCCATKPNQSSKVA